MSDTPEEKIEGKYSTDELVQRILSGDPEFADARKQIIEGLREQHGGLLSEDPVKRKAAYQKIIEESSKDEHTDTVRDPAITEEITKRLERQERATRELERVVRQSRDVRGK